MSDIKHGGPAFPGPYMNDKGQMEVVAKQGGMTLRDYFAGQVLAVFAKDYVHDNSDVIADQAYTLADAMLAAREVKP